jgi:hypothetical protein
MVARQFFFRATRRRRSGSLTTKTGRRRQRVFLLKAAKGMSYQDKEKADFSGLKA